MGKLAGQTLLASISKTVSREEIPQTLTVEPELVIRNSTAMAKKL